MTITEAIAFKILEYCNKNNLSINKFALKCCLTQSTVNNIINKKTKNIKISTVYRICIGMEINISKFYEDKIFDLDNFLF